jgi:4-hydroxy-2-oxoheptanedioate aldolase
MLLGTVIASPDIALAELAAAHLDFIWIDLEHSPLTVHDVLGLSVAARASGSATLVRLPRSDSDALPALLDLGVDGIIAPRVDTPEIAAQLATAVRYPPDGTRGFAPRRATAFGVRDGERAPDPLCFVQVESRQGVELVDAIASVRGIDGLIVGPADLSRDLGVPFDLTARELRKAIAAVQEAAARAGIVSGIAAAGEMEAIVDLMEGGCTLLAYSADVRLYAEAIFDTALRVSRVWSRAAAPGGS